ncbi:MAG TPA: hypothetical protein VNE86_02550, partial [Nitrososphaerales archaeon]|nr:hypothetical protein [Nitrososphaerales archaeon]
MSPKMAAIVGYFLDEKFTDPAINEMAITSDGFVMAGHEGDIGLNDMIGTDEDLNRNIDSL